MRYFKNLIWRMLIGACIVIAPVVWIVQADAWLKTAQWKPIPLSIITGKMSGSDMLGLQLIINWVADLNLGESVRGSLPASGGIMTRPPTNDE